MPKLSVTDLDVAGKRVLVRVDFNVPLDENANVTDDRRIRMALPSIVCALDAGAKLILMSHLGRPKGGPTPEFSMKPNSKRLGELLKKPVTQLDDCVGAEVEKAGHHPAFLLHIIDLDQPQTGVEKGDEPDGGHGNHDLLAPLLDEAENLGQGADEFVLFELLFYDSLHRRLLVKK